MKFVALSSGSSGNCIFVSSTTKKILIDLGISLKEVKKRLNEIGESFDDIDCIFLTHSHDDHIKGLFNISLNDNVKICAVKDTYDEIIEKFEKNKKDFNYENALVIPNSACKIRMDDNFIIEVCKAYHDVFCVYYKIFVEDKIIAILTDNGHYDKNIIQSLSNVNYLMLECNYDDSMLMSYDKYPQFLKKRISSDNGHLSNVACCEIIKNIINDDLKVVCLSHISEHSNSYEYALQFVNDYIENNISKDLKKPDIIVATKYKITNICNDNNF